jgi:hypothetical protein
MPDDLNAWPPREPDEAGSVSFAAEAGFDELLYLRSFPDVVGAIERGDVTSGWHHYMTYGRAEGRLQSPPYRKAMSVDIVLDRQVPTLPAHSIDVVVVTRSGAVFIVGWADDRVIPLTAVSVGLQRGMIRSWPRFPRLRRPDVEAAVAASAGGQGDIWRFGFWVLGDAGTLPLRGQALATQATCDVELCFANGAVAELNCDLVVQDAFQFRETAMGYFANTEYPGNRTVEAFCNLDLDAGEALIAFNKKLSLSVTAGAVVERFGPAKPALDGSIIVVLYGIADFFFLQSCLFAQGRGIAGYEFIYVLNSPELIEPLQRQARISQMAYGLSQTLVMLPGNAGFGAANNIAVQFARSDRLLCLNPDVFPRDREWARRHTDCVASLPGDQTRLFGTSLYYDDGSLMHGGMYFESDAGTLLRGDGITQRRLLRVEHYGKGAPSWASQFVASRRVPAVTGAFMSVARSWFEALGGFSEDYIFGHYEDADLCLKSLREGTPAWIHDIPMWHLEGKGSTRLPSHEGGSMLNRWLFSRTWDAMVSRDLLGPDPAHPLLRADAVARQPKRNIRPARAGRG